VATSRRWLQLYLLFMLLYSRTSCAVLVKSVLTGRPSACCRAADIVMRAKQSTLQLDCYDCSRSLFSRRLAELMSPVRRLLAGGRSTLAVLFSSSVKTVDRRDNRGRGWRSADTVPDHTAAKVFSLWCHSGVLASLFTFLSVSLSSSSFSHHSFLYFFPHYSSWLNDSLHK